MGSQLCGDCRQHQPELVILKSQNYLFPKQLTESDTSPEPEFNERPLSDHRNTTSGSHATRGSVSRKNQCNQPSASKRPSIFEDTYDWKIETHKALQEQLITFGNGHDDSALYQSQDKLKTPITESELLYDSVFRPIKRSTFNLTYSVSEVPNKSDAVPPNRVSHHNRGMSQPINQKNQPEEGFEVLYCNNDPNDLVTLPVIHQNRILNTFDKTKNKRAEHLRSQSWSPIASTKDKEEDTYISLIAEEVDDVFEKGIRERKFLVSEIDNGTPIFNKYDRVEEVLEFQADTKSDTVVSSHINEFSKFFANDPEVNGLNRRFYQTEIPIQSHNLPRTRLSEVHRERADLIDFEQESPEIPTTRNLELRLSAADRAYSQKQSEKKLEERFNQIQNNSILPIDAAQPQLAKNDYKTRFYNHNKHKDRPESISTADNVSNLHTKNNSEEIHITTRLRALEKELTTEKIPEYQALEQLLVRGKFVESLIFPADKPARLSNYNSQKELLTNRSQGIYKSFQTSPQSKVFQQ